MNELQDNLRDVNTTVFVSFQEEGIDFFDIPSEGRYMRLEGRAFRLLVPSLSRINVDQEALHVARGVWAKICTDPVCPPGALVVYNSKRIYESSGSIGLAIDKDGRQTERSCGSEARPWIAKLLPLGTSPFESAGTKLGGVKGLEKPAPMPVTVQSWWSLDAADAL